MSQSLALAITENLLFEARRRIINESIPRIEKCLDLLFLDQIWHKPNQNSNSVGHLVLHLCGNATQWICSGIGNLEDQRVRYLEFTSENHLSADQLKSKLKQLAIDIESVLATIKPSDLIKIKKVQVYEESILSILIHVIEHFSYHTGQITYYTKWILDTDTGYYKNQNLEIING